MDSHGELDSLIAIFDQVRASKFILFLEPALIAYLSCLVPYSTLTKHGVQSLVPLTREVAAVKQNTASAFVYISTADPESLALVAQSAKLHLPHAVTLILTPEVPPSVQLFFTKHGIYGDIDIKEWAVSLIPDAITPDILQLFHAESLRDPNAGVWPLVHSLDALQRDITGAFGKLTAIGQRARSVALLLEQRSAENSVLLQQDETSPDFAEYHFGYSSSTFFGAEVEHAVIIDRDIDLVTPLLCQTTYEGVLAETVGISSSGTTQLGLKTSLRNDPVFATIAERGFSDACEVLHENAKDLQQEYRAGGAATASASSGISADSPPSIAEIRKVVTKLGSLQATQRLVDTHTELALLAMTRLERRVQREAFSLQTDILESRITNSQAVARLQDLIYQGAPLPLVLRLLSLLCLIRGGLKESMLQMLLYEDILKTYGYENLDTIHYLRSRGLLFSPKGSSFLFSASPLASFGLGGGYSHSDTNAGNANANAGAPGSSASSIKFTTSQSTTSGISQSGGGGGGTAFSTLGQGKPRDAENRAANTLKGYDNDGISGPQLVQTYSWYSCNKAYKLFPSESTESKPYAGIVPLTARVSQLALDPSTRAKTPLEPEFLDIVHSSKDLQTAREAKLRRTLLRNSKTNNHSPVILVVVVGGVTYAEATAIKQAIAVSSNSTEKSTAPRRVVVASTSVTTGDEFVKL